MHFSLNYARLKSGSHWHNTQITDKNKIQKGFFFIMYFEISNYGVKAKTPKRSLNESSEAGPEEIPKRVPLILQDSIGPEGGSKE